MKQNPPPTSEQFLALYTSLSRVDRMRFHLHFMAVLIRERWPLGELLSGFRWLIWPDLWRASLILAFSILLSASLFNLVGR